MTVTTAAPPPPPPAPEPGRKPSGGRRVLKAVVLIVLLIIVIGIAVLYINLNSIVRRTVETQTAASLNVPAKLEAASVSIFGGSVELKNFDIGNPAGFKTDQLMTLGEVDVNVKISELRQDPLKVSKIDLTAPKMVIEMAGTGFNIKKFVDQLPPTETEPMKLVIGEMNVKGAQVVFRPDVAAMSSVPGIGEKLAGLREEYVLKIPDLKLESIGTGEGNQNGAAIKEVVSLLVTQLAAKAAQSEQLPPELRQLLSLNVNDIAGSLKQKLGEEAKKKLDDVAADLTKDMSPAASQAVGDILKNPQEAAKDPGKAIEKGLGDLLGKKKPATQPATRPAR